MAEGDGSKQLGMPDPDLTANGGPSNPRPALPANQDPGDGQDDDDEGDDEEEDEDDEEEPRLKYATVTKKISPLFKNGDAVSCFLVAGDKMVVGTHSGNVHALSLPLFQPIRGYHAHSASVSAVSISPFPPPLPAIRPDVVSRLTSENISVSPQASSGSANPKPGAKQTQLAANASNSIYIGTASIDGNVCISSLIDPKDVQLRNFGRPIQAIALSPDYKRDHSYLSGGQAGSLVLTTGGQAGKSAKANLGGAAAATQGWLGVVGLGSSTGSDKVLHSGEGTINTIKWSLSGKYVLWVNEQGIKIMRSNLNADSGEVGFEWKRISHIDRPARPNWEDMAGVWKARVEWFERDNFDLGDGQESQTTPQNDEKATKATYEEAVIGWGDTVWLIRVHGPKKGTGKDSTEKKFGRAEVMNILRMDCTIAGVSLYTQSVLAVLAYTESAENASAQSNSTSSAKGRHQRHIALEPELRLIDINTKEEVSTDALTVSRYENLSASDYHLGVLPPIKLPGIAGGRGAFGTITSGLETIGQGVWDVSMYPTRLFSSGASAVSGRSDEKRSVNRTDDSGSGRNAPLSQQPKELVEVASSVGIKLFIFSPYDCVVALKRDLQDRLQWLVKTTHYQKAWELLYQHPEAAGASSGAESSDVSSPTTPSRAGSEVAGPGKATNSLFDFFGDTSSEISRRKTTNINSIAEKEKRRIGELWLQQLTAEKDWTTAGEVASKVLNTSTRWQHWAWVFISSHKFDEISGFVPTFDVTPPLPSLIYEVILGHYVSIGRTRFRELLDIWPCTLFDVASIITAVEDQLRDKIATPKEGDDWRILQDGLAKLFVASGRLSDALRCYIRLQDADTALILVREHHLLRSLADEVPSLILLRVSQSQLDKSSTSELEDLTSEPISLLVDGAHHGTVQPSQVVSQLNKGPLQPFLFFYLRALWLGQGAQTSSDDIMTTPRPASHRVGQLNPPKTAHLVAEDGHMLVDQFADIAVTLFARYDRPLLTSFLKTSTSYTFSHAVSVCESLHYTEDLVYLLSKTGQVKKALFLLIEELHDVPGAIAFAKAQVDPELWDDLLEYSMSRPRFIQGLLAEAGTAVDPIKLVKRIPSGLEVEGLKQGLGKMIREYELQDSICGGVAGVLLGEVAVGMGELRRGRNKGVRFDVDIGRRPRSKGGHEKASKERPIIPGHCAACSEPFDEYDPETLIGFACSHVYHASHLFHRPSAAYSHSPSSSNPTPTKGGQVHPHNASSSEEDNVKSDVDIQALLSAPLSRSIGAKVTNAKLLQMRIEEAGGCWVCKEREKHGGAGR